MSTGLFVTPRRRRWSGTRALAIRDADCVCGPLQHATFTQPALFYHGGHGAAEKVNASWCLCGKVKRRDTVPTNPRHPTMTLL